MTNIPYFRITSCCNVDETGLFFIPNSVQGTDGTFTFNGVLDITVGDVTFTNGNCYVIKYQGNAIDTSPYLIAPDVSYFDLVTAKVEDCGNPLCAECAPIFSKKLIFTSCCDSNDVLEFKGDDYLDYDSLLKPNTLFPLPVGFTNTCYKITVEDVSDAEYSVLNDPPPAAQMIILSDDATEDCTDYVNECPACPAPECYTLVNCEGLYFNSVDPNLETVVGQFIQIEIETGTWFVLQNNGKCSNPVASVGIITIDVEPCPCLCYEIVGTLKSLQYINCDNEIVKDATVTKFCSRIYPIYSGTAGQFRIVEGGECVDGACPVICYKLTNCDTGEIIYSNLQSLSQYVNTSSIVTLSGYEGCWRVEESIANCDCITVVIDQGEPGIIQYQANSIGTYNGYNVYQYTDGTYQYYIWYDAGKGWYITLNGYGGSELEIAYTTYSGSCPDSEDNLFTWSLGEVIYTSIQTKLCPSLCDCPVNVIVSQTYTDCPTCLGITAYKLTNCENSSDIKYTYDDLSDYINQTVKTDCGCYLVELINYQPPSVTSIVIICGFKNCTDCLKQYYILTDCNETEDPEDPVYTYTDLSLYLDKIIKIKGCDTCWIVNEVEIPINPGIVTVDAEYDECIECTVPLTCTCNRMTNYDVIQRRYTYIDCNDEEQGFILQPGESSGKICLKVWTLTWPDTDNLEVFGECIDTQDPKFAWECPIILPKRKITPGYNVPSCDIEKWEKITCRSAEILYKEVMRLRYGMSNCCPEDDNKWLIKKELIDLAALVDPNYICTPVQTCCDNTPTCGCGCNTTLKTCNSQ